MRNPVVPAPASTEREDWGLITRARAGNDEAWDALSQRHRRMVARIARTYFLPGGDADDLLQEAWCGFMKAVRAFQPDRGVPFAQYAAYSMRRHLVSALKSALRQKHRPLNTALRLDAPIGLHTDVTWAEQLPAPDTADPDRILADRMAFQEWLTGIAAAMTPLEWRVLILTASGLSHQDLAVKLGIDAKAVDNALQRSKRKAMAQGLPDLPASALRG